VSPLSAKQLAWGGASLVVAGVLGWASTRYKVARPSSFFAINGLGISNTKVAKNVFLWPFQSATELSLTPKNHGFTINNLFTKDRLNLKVKIMVNFRPFDPIEHQAKAVAYATWCSEQESGGGGPLEGQTSIQSTILNAIEGDIRQSILAMDAKELLDAPEDFRSKVIEKIQKKLEEFGIQIPVLNVNDFEDCQNGDYLTTITQKTLATTRADAAIAVSEAALRQAKDTNKNNGETAESDKEYHIKIAGYNQMKAEKDIAVAKDINEKQLEMERAKEAKRQEQQTAFKRAVEMSRVAVEAEAVIAKATGEASAGIAKANGEATAAVAKATGEASAGIAKANGEATAAVARAKGDAEAIQLRAVAELYKAETEATAIKAKLAAEASGLHELLSVAPNHGMPFLMMKDGLYEKLAKANATAINGLQPRINVWNTGDTSKTDTFAPLRNLMGNLPPMFDFLRGQLNEKVAEDIVSSSSSSTMLASQKPKASAR